MTARTWIRGICWLAPVLALGACASGPPTGFVKMNDAKTEGVFRWNDGSRYEGGIRNETFEGNGTIYFRGAFDTVYDRSTDPNQLSAGSLSAKFVDGRRTYGPGTFAVPNTGANDLRFVGFIYEGEMEDGTRGQGHVKFRDGREYQGHFDYTPALYDWMSTSGDSLWNTSALLGSKISGAG